MVMGAKTILANVNKNFVRELLKLDAGWKFEGFYEMF